MNLRSVYVRFHKSFNYDYRRKIDPQAHRKPWEFVGDQFYPHVEVPIDALITTVVGSNESGKTHLLSAIEKGITGSGNADGIVSPIEWKDFCRYSHFFQSTKAGTPRYPDFGFQWVDLEPTEKNAVLTECGVDESRTLSRFFFFRTKDKSVIYLPKEDDTGFDGPYNIKNESDFLPSVFRIDSRIALPDRISIHQLLRGRMKEEAQWNPFDRQQSYAYADAASEIEWLLDTIEASPLPAGQSTFSLSSNVKDKARELSAAIRRRELELRREEKRREIKAFNLAYDLLFKIAEVATEDVEMLRNALRDGETGVVRSVVDKINHALAVRLRFPRVWSQDRNFALRVEATEHELSFIINDRTGCQYSFDERSSGLKHFLSYYIQYLTHEAPSGASFEILLMDEPDAYLSGEAQQDLLKIFQMFSDPSLGKGDTARPIQVIYVTHSPFLIDKNHAERVRALEKPEGSKGTRVIKSGAQNHYEPVRSAFGAFVGETTFISQCNLMVEGLADQILLAGGATYLRRLGKVGESEMLDLNRITIVPAGGASHIPYLVYLARGRDPEKPAVITMLDSDANGDDARKKLGKDGQHPNKRRLLDSRFILQLGEISLLEVEPDCDPKKKNERPFKVIEDLVPLPMAVEAARTFAKNMYDLTEADLSTLTVDAVSARVKPDKSPFDTIKEIFSELPPAGSMDIDKVPFARSVVDMLPALAREREDTETDPYKVGIFDSNMRAVFRRLREMQTAAEEDTKDKRMREIVSEKVATFLSDFEENRAAMRDDVTRLLRDIESDLEGDEHERGFIIQEIARIRELHNLGEDPTERVTDFDALIEGLSRIRSAKDLLSKDADMNIPKRKPKDKTKPEGNREASAAANV